MTATRSAVETDIIIGVDTHKDIHAAVAIDRLGRRLEHRTVATTKSGLIELLNWAQHLGRDRAWGVEGAGSYGAGLTRLLLSAGERCMKCPARTGECDVITASLTRSMLRSLPAASWPDKTWEHPKAQAARRPCVSCVRPVEQR